MRIAMVSEHASPLACVGGVDAGGQNVHVAALSGALAAKGHQVTVFTRADNPALPRRVQYAAGVVVEHVHAGPVTYVPKDELPQYMPSFAAVLRHRWSHQAPDVVHAHFWMSGLASLSAVSGTSTPVVQTFHALGTVKRRWQGENDSSPAERAGAEAWIARSADRILATCRDEVEELSAMAGTAPIDVVPCGVDTSAFAPDPGRSRPGRRLLVVGRLVARKGVQDAISALSRIPDAELVVVGGPSPDRLESDDEVRRLAEIADRLGVRDRVRFSGRATRDELPAMLNSAALVLAVPWYEPFGIVPLEAMACGVPVVGTAVGGLLDTVVDGVTGMLVPPRRPDRIAAAVNRLLGNEKARNAMGAAGRARTERYYSWDCVASATENAYRRAIAGKKRRIESEPGTATVGASQ